MAEQQPLLGGEKTCYGNVVTEDPPEVAQRLTAGSRGWRPYYRQFLVALLAIQGAMNVGVTSVYASPTGPVLREQGVLVTEQQVSWFSSIVYIGSIFGGLLAMTTVESIGRKHSAMLFTFPCVLGWTLVSAGSSVPILLMGRLLGGVALSAISCSLSVYVAETLSKEIRGSLYSCMFIGVSLGDILVYALSMVLGPQWLAVACALPSMGMCLLLVALPQTPRYLLKQGKPREASASLQWLRNAESAEEVKDELEDIVRVHRISGSHVLSLREFLTRRRFLYPLLLVVALMTVTEGSGISAVLAYTKDILINAGYQDTANLSALFVVVVRLLGFIIMACLVDRVGRKILYSVSACIMTLSCVTFGVYYYLSEVVRSDTDLGVMALVSLVFYMLGNSLGMGPVTGILSGELFPLRARGYGMAVFLVLDGALAFVVTFVFLPMVSVMHMYGVFWFYGGVCFVGCLLGVLVLPETKGKTLEEIEQDITSRGESPASK